MGSYAAYQSGIAEQRGKALVAAKEGINRLTAENARLREALERIANRMVAYAEPEEAAHDMKSIARQALKEGK